MINTIAQFVQRARSLGLRLRIAALLLMLSAVAILLEGFGVAMFLPILQFMQAGGDVDQLTGAHWRFIKAALSSIGLAPSLGILLIMSFLAFLGRQIFTYTASRYKAWVQQETAHALRSRIFHGYTRANASHHDRSMLGGLINDVNVELPRGVNALYATVRLASVFMLIGLYLVGLLTLSTWMTLISVGVLVVTATLLQGLIAESHRTSTEITLANQNLSAFITDRLRSMRLIRLSRTEAAELNQLQALSRKQRDNEVLVRKLSARIEALTEPVALFAGLAMLYVGFIYLKLDVTILGMFLLILLRLLPVTKDALKSVQSIAGQWASLRTIEKRLESMREAREPKGGQLTFAKIQDAIKFADVNFKYDNGAVALAGLSFTIPARKMTAIVGPSGSGKSTLIDLLPRLRDPVRGSIEFDDVPIDNFSIESLRKGIAYVPQRPNVFNVTVEEHIRYGRPEATDSDVHRAADIAGAAEFIARLPDGYSTKLGEDGASLSGGQRQRLDLARAVIQEAPILILDEPTSALDAHSEARFREALFRIRTETESTIIIVGHRLSSISHADHIIVVEHGRVSESGNHPALLDAGGWYAGAFGQQQHVDAAYA